MSNLTFTNINVNVTFTPPTTNNGSPTFSYSINTAQNNGFFMVGANQFATMNFLLNMASETSGTVAWANPPITWGPPECMSDASSGNVLTIGDNNGLTGIMYSFVFNVNYTNTEGQTTFYTSPDPTILNTPITSSGSGG